MSEKNNRVPISAENNYNGGELFKLQIHQYKSLTINSHYVHVDVLYVYE